MMCILKARDGVENSQIKEPTPSGNGVLWVGGCEFSDAVKKEVFLNNNKKFSRPWNIGPYESSNISVKNIIEKAKQNWKKGIIDYQNDENKLHEASILKLDISDALNILNWSPKLDIDLTVKMTINWYKKFYNGNQAYKLILNDLKFYKKLL